MIDEHWQGVDLPRQGSDAQGSPIDTNDFGIPDERPPTLLGEQSIPRNPNDVRQFPLLLHAHQTTFADLAERAHDSICSSASRF